MPSKSDASQVRHLLKYFLEQQQQHFARVADEHFIGIKILTNASVFQNSNLKLLLFEISVCNGASPLTLFVCLVIIIRS